MPNLGDMPETILYAVVVDGHVFDAFDDKGSADEFERACHTENLEMDGGKHVIFQVEIHYHPGVVMTPPCDEHTH